MVVHLRRPNLQVTRLNSQLNYVNDYAGLDFIDDGGDFKQWKAYCIIDRVISKQ